MWNAAAVCSIGQQQAYQPAPPVYAGLSSSLLYGGSYGGSLAGGSVADGDSYTPSIAIGEVGPYQPYLNSSVAGYAGGEEF